MNIWTKKNFNLYDSQGYLDSLHNIYPMLNNPVRSLDPEMKEKIRQHFDQKNDKELFKIIINLEKSPIKDSYKAYFTNVPKKEQDKIIKKNPESPCQDFVGKFFKKIFSSKTSPF